MHSMRWFTMATAPRGKQCLFWLVTRNPANSGPVIAQISAYEPGKFWDGYTYRPVAWLSHWMPLPAPPRSFHRNIPAIARFGDAPFAKLQL